MQWACLFDSIAAAHVTPIKIAISIWKFYESQFERTYKFWFKVNHRIPISSRAVLKLLFAYIKLLQMNYIAY